ncbi:MAG: hypothetical protein CMJ18_00410 [Phycisphaeraceae bacterium]|nr:hypothetical protein [Phycisphaeraceae bacterium]
MRPIYNLPVIPEDGDHYRACTHKPLTRAEMKCDFRNALFMKHPDSQACWEAILRYDLASAVYFYSRHWIRETDGTEQEGWRHNLRRLADAGVYIFHVGMHWYGQEQSRACFDFLLDTFGARFIGLKADSEADGGYTGGWSWTGPWAEQLGTGATPSPQRSRTEARRDYDRVLDWLYDRAFHRGMSISSLGYGCHYAAEHEARMLGIEAEECLPSDTLLWSFCRGASKQYDLLTAVSISPANRWGHAMHFRDGPMMTDGESTGGSDYGPSHGLNRREWYVAYMCGASLIFFSAAIFHYGRYASKVSGEYEPFIMPGGANRPGFGLLEANLTPVGRLHVEGQEFAAAHPVRGTCYMPVALMLERDHGWNPPGEYYGPGQDCVWGNIPYARGDHQIDNFFRWVYPDYHLASFYRDERGYITNTPFGDLFEVILSNASPACLEKYRAIVLLGEQRVADDASERLETFLRDGGIVIAAADQWPAGAAALAGASVSDTLRNHHGESRSADGSLFREARFEHRDVRITKGDVLLETSGGAALVTRHTVGDGTLYLVNVPGWGRSAKRHDMLDGIRHVIGSVLDDLGLVTIEGRPVYNLVNVTDRDDELIVTLCNNSPDLPWEGTVRIRDAEVESFEAWIGHSEAAVEDGALRCGVPANDVRIFKLQASHGFLPLRFRNIDWRKLGVGIPDQDFQSCPARKSADLTIHRPGDR